MNNIELYEVRRPPLDVPAGPKIHCGIALRNGSTGTVVVLHNTPGQGEHLGSFEEFHAGLPRVAEPIPVSIATLERFNAVLCNPQAYDVLTNNCEHTVNTIKLGCRRSPTVRLICFVLGLILLYWLTEKRTQSQG